MMTTVITTAAYRFYKPWYDATRQLPYKTAVRPLIVKSRYIIFNTMNNDRKCQSLGS